MINGEYAHIISLFALIRLRLLAENRHPAIRTRCMQTHRGRKTDNTGADNSNLVISRHLPYLEAGRSGTGKGGSLSG